MDQAPISATREVLATSRPLGVTGGGTTFHDLHDDVGRAVMPLVVLDGVIRHAGRAPCRIRCAPGYTMAIEIERIAADRGA